jgi:putative ABC transport system ATP-binding protein
MTTQNPDGPLSIAPPPAAVQADACGGAANILEQWLFDTSRIGERAHVRRVVREAAEAFPGETSELWWRWIGEAGTNLGLKCKVVDCSPSELCELALHGARLAIYVSGANLWLAVTAVRGRKLRLTQAFAERGSRWGDTGQLLHLLGNPPRNAVLRCVIIENAVAYAEAVGESSHGMPPLKRLWALLRPERTDIFILTVFSIVVGLLALSTPIAVETVVNTLTFSRFVQPLVVLAILLFVFLAFSAAIRALQTYVVEIIQCRLFARVTADLSYRIPRVRSETLDDKYLPELVNRFFDVITVQKVAALLLLDGLLLIVSTIVGIVVLALFHPWLLAYNIVLLACLAFLIFVLGRGAVASAIQESRCKYHTAAWLQDLARCAVAFKTGGAAEFALERADQLVCEYLAARKKHFHVLMRQVFFALAIQAVASAVLLGIGGWLVMTGELTLGQLVAAELIVAVVVGSFAKVGKYLEGYYDLLASINKLGALFDLPIEQQEGILHRFPARPSSLTVHDVDYALAHADNVLNAVSLKIESGDRVALVGSGESELLDLMFGLRSPSRGHLSLDGVDPRDLRADHLRRRVALVRHIEVFHGSVVENVHLARPEVAATEVRDALELVGVLDDLLRLPDGIETELTSGGNPLTDNQLRRVMLARAIVGRPGLLLLDRVLDSLSDSDTEELMRMLCDPSQPWSLVVVTDRASVRAFCKRVFELDSTEPCGEPSVETENPNGDEQ